MKINLMSKSGEKITLNLSFPYIYNRYKVKKLMAKGYRLVGEEDALIMIRLKLY
ncbi:MULTISPECIES: hypothetical protein [Psychrilyobacter]|uniref:hypothetical protein n=1 Tax=Psychrilyobacter TaxID=623282 RepID=UPI0013146570|nr:MULTISPECIES: hypothetical protein [Psychrilyobacter]MCS5421752.1 hypothetical protein [Psychrilyobacter sp. S5]NDI77057.1 hypothetical protein [Psychrilyobacter piezotolerans]